MHATLLKLARALRNRAATAALAALLCAAAFAASGPALAQRAYPTPEAAAEAMGDAIASSDRAALAQVLGAGYPALLPEGGVHQDDIYAFLAAWARHHAIQPQGADRAVVAVGDSGWTFPVPLARTPAGWKFDLAAGRKEVHARRIGRNELATLDTLRQLAEAQQRYAQQVGGGRYATRLVSSAGKTDGLYWPAVSAGDPSPLGPDALAMGPDTPPEAAFYGYHYRVLPPGSGGDATFRFIAWPARYGQSGVHTFVMGSDRVAYQRDLGPATAARAAALRTFAPGEGWARVENP
ncbi:DUF2950 family protein [Cupriavidus sp. 30B13]|uniref:DUF2950 family protein n=1 Tax=Cupriavidus sp. 30B13 TaxID=3384241 RepID=UPI003B90C7A4